MITLRNLTKRYGVVPALTGVSLEAERPGVLALSGPSGSGKTTLLRLVAGLEEPDAGEVHLDGRIVSQPGTVRPAHERGVGFVFQSPALWPHLNVARNISFGLNHLAREAARTRVEELLALLSLEGFGARYPEQLSGGEAGRVALARALAPRPRYLLLDEPFANVELELKRRMLDVVQETLTQNPTCLLYVTHDAMVSEQLGGRRVLLQAGRAVA